MTMLYDILQDFAGSQDGRFAERFTAGTQAELSEWLAAAAPPGFIRPAGETRVRNKAIATDGSSTGTLTAKREK